MEMVVLRLCDLVLQHRPQLRTCLCLSVLLLPFFGADVRADRARNAISLDFQGLTWVAANDAELSVESYRGHQAVKIRTRGMNSSAKIQNLNFSEGRLELEIAFTGRIPPWICFHGIRGNEADQMMVNPLAETQGSSTSRLYRAVLTREKFNSLIINYRQVHDKFDPTRWTHVAIVSNEGLCRIYIDRDEIPVGVLESFFNAGVIGIRGECFVRNVVTTPVKD